MSLEPYRKEIRDFFIGVSLGAYPGHSCFNKFGFNASVSSSFEDIWGVGGNYVFPDDTSVTMIISSSDTADHGDTVNDTGAKTVEIFGLDEDFAEQSEVVTLDGQTGVNSAGKYSRLFRMIVRSAGAGAEADSNIGVIYAGIGALSSGVPATPFASIRPGVNQTEMAIYTIPANRIGLIVSLYGSVEADVSMHLELQVRPEGEVFQVKHGEDVTHSVVHQFTPPERVEPKSDVKIRGLMQIGAAKEAHAGFDIVLAPNL